MNAQVSLFQTLRDELPKCGRHRDTSHIDCVECMYLSTKVYAPLEAIQAALRELTEAVKPYVPEAFRWNSDGQTVSWSTREQWERAQAAHAAAKELLGV